MQKSLKKLFLSSAMLFSILFVLSMPVKAKEASSWTQLQSFITDSTVNETIKLSDDIIASNGDSALVIAAGKNVTIDLNSKKINRNLSSAVEDGYVIKVEEGACLTITDSSTGRNGKITGGNSTANGGGVHVDGTLNMYGGTISGNTTSKNGGGVYVDGSLNMYGGTISGNTASSDGGGVYVLAGEFTMTGDSVISDNSSKCGGGAYIVEKDTIESTFSMSSNSQIKNNTASNLYGGVYIKKSSFSMADNSQIVGNHATNNIGGVGMALNATLNMTGGSICNNSAANYGGVFINNSTLNMIGGEISGNTATTNYGGVYVASGTLTLGGTAVITGNVVNSKPYNVGLANGKYIALDEPSSGMSIGVSTQTDPTAAAPIQITTNGSLTDTGYFSSDNDAYEVKFDTDHLVLSVKPHTHNLVKVDGQPATEEASGWKDYYECDEIADACHMYFEDSEGNTSITDFAAWKAEGGNGYIAKLNAPKYGITVLNDGNGTASASLSEAASGTAVTLTATPASGYEFDKWEVISGNITVNDNKFIIADSHVKINAIFKKQNDNPLPPDPEPEEQPYYIESLEDQLDVAIAYAQKDETILWTAGDSLPQSVIDLILQSDVTVEFKFTYEGVDYDLFLNKNNVQNLNIPWYGPYVLAQFANNTTSALEGDLYTVQNGDTMSIIAAKFGMTLEELASMNPQITNINMIYEGQVIRVK